MADLPLHLNTWTDFFTLDIFLLAFYFVLTFAQRMLPRLSMAERYLGPVRRTIDYIILAYEPLVILIVTSNFILIDPVLHGTLVAILLLAGFSHVRNYVSGRLVRLDPSIKVGERLKLQNTQGIITEKGRLGLHLRSSKGKHFINYSQLYSEGYLLLSGEEIGGFYQLNIRPRDPEEKVDYARRLSDLLTTTPYLDWNHTPEIRANTNNETLSYQARFSVREEGHLRDLIALIEKEWDCVCKISKNKN